MYQENYGKIKEGIPVLERPLPEQDEYKKTFKQKGGVSSIVGASELNADEIYVRDGKGNSIAIKNYNGSLGVYQIDNSGKHTLVSNITTTITE